MRTSDLKEEIIETENLAKEIIHYASDHAMTLEQLKRALKLAERIALHSPVSRDSVDQHDYISTYFAVDENE